MSAWNIYIYNNITYILFEGKNYDLLLYYYSTLYGLGFEFYAFNSST